MAEAPRSTGHEGERYTWLEPFTTAALPKMTALLAGAQHHGKLDGVLFKTPLSSFEGFEDPLRLTQELLKTGHAKHADNVVSAALEQGPQDTGAMLLKAMACLQASDMAIGRDTAPALEAVKWARRALRKALQTAASSDHIAALRLTLAQALQSSANSSPGIPLAQQEQYSDVISRNTDDVTSPRASSPGADSSVTNGSPTATDDVSTPVGRELAGGARVSSPLDAAMEGLPQVDSGQMGDLVWALLALILTAERHLDLAMQSLEQGLALAAEQHVGLLMKIKGRLQVAQGDVEGGLKTLAWVLKRVQGGQEAASALTPSLGPEQLSAWDNQVMEAWLELARVYLTSGDVDKAVQCHKEAMALTPEGRAVMIMQAGLHQVAGDQAAAMAVLNKALVTWPGLPRASTMLGNALLSQGDPYSLTLAEGYFRDVLRQSPYNHRAWAGLGQVLSQRRQLAEASRCCQAAAELASTEPLLPFSSMPLVP
ncbi:hypothetical protein WJX73_009298 [Symbiochloris irregularis]|uniref:Uncharacterized protein n=1 Tax=Symbiochloris irregularis TaxID=706552 RepID=A0AAW1NU15_9CHLO